MKITVFTGNQPRHLALVRHLSTIADELFAVIECKTVFTGVVQDKYNKSPIIEEYFKNVHAAERQIFGPLSFIERNTRTLPLRTGDLSLLSFDELKEALSSDVYIVFGSSFIKGWLIDYLMARKALNIHMGISPYYRGHSCNFWALYDQRPDMVGATIHYISAGLDSGPMLYHALPNLSETSTPFEFTMRAVLAAHKSLVDRISTGEIFSIPAQQQDKSHEIRYTRGADFTDDVAREYLARNLTNLKLKVLLERPTIEQLLRPYYY